MAALQSPFFGEKQNLYALMRKIDKCEYPPIPSNIYSQQVLIYKKKELKITKNTKIRIKCKN
jgi:NIMA (never in mitosis gene a)-related kinase